MPRQKKTDSTAPQNMSYTVTSIKYSAKRKNIPPAGLEAQGVLQKAPRIRYEYNPHLPPMLRSATEPKEADKLPELP
jgi:adenine-specific DNA-methyltransferase